MKKVSPDATIKEVLETAIDELVEKGIFWNEAGSQFEKLFILKALKKNQGILSHTARTMGVHRNTLTKKIREYAIDLKKYRQDKGGKNEK